MSAFDSWWDGQYGPFSVRAEWCKTPQEGAKMAWEAQQEKVDEARKTALREAAEIAEKAFPLLNGKEIAALIRIHAGVPAKSGEK